MKKLTNIVSVPPTLLHALLLDCITTLYHSEISCNGINLVEGSPWPPLLINSGLPHYTWHLEAILSTMYGHENVISCHWVSGLLCVVRYGRYLLPWATSQYMLGNMQSIQVIVNPSFLYEFLLVVRATKCQSCLQQTILDPYRMVAIIIPPPPSPTQQSWRGVYSYHLVLLSVCPSVDRIVSALYLQQYSLDPFHILHILSSNSRRCVACKVYFKIRKLKLLANSFNLYFWLCLVLTWDPIWRNSMGDHGVAWGILRTQAF